MLGGIEVFFYLQDYFKNLLQIFCLQLVFSKQFKFSQNHRAICNLTKKATKLLKPTHYQRKWWRRRIRNSAQQHCGAGDTLPPNTYALSPPGRAERVKKKQIDAEKSCFAFCQLIVCARGCFLPKPPTLPRWKWAFAQSHAHPSSLCCKVPGAYLCRGQTFFLVSNIQRLTKSIENWFRALDARDDIFMKCLANQFIAAEITMDKTWLRQQTKQIIYRMTFLGVDLCLHLLLIVHDTGHTTSKKGCC